MNKFTKTNLSDSEREEILKLRESIENCEPEKFHDYLDVLIEFVVDKYGKTSDFAKSLKNPQLSRSFTGIIYHETGFKLPNGESEGIKPLKERKKIVMDLIEKYIKE